MKRFLALALGVVAAGAWAQSPQEYFKVVDRDGNGYVSLPEFQDWMSRAFHQMDGDRDGVLEPHEQLVPDAPRITLADLHERLARQFARQDRDRDGRLSAKEYLAPPQ